MLLKKRPPKILETWRFEAAAPEDARAINDIRTTIWWETADRYGVSKSDIAERLTRPGTGEMNLAFKLAASDRVCEVARVTGKVVGYCMAQLGEDVNRIESLYVLPAFRNRGGVRSGERQTGIGSLLLNKVIGQLGDKDITLATHINNDGAQRLYASFGFEPTGFIKDTAETGAIVFASGAVFPEIELILSHQNGA